MVCLAEGSPHSRRLVVVVVFVALLLDSMLLTVIVPIVPTFLYSIEHPVNASRGTQRSPLALPRPNAPVLGPAHNATPSAGSPLGPLSSSNSSSNTARCLEDISSLNEENFKVGALLASKALVELIASPIVGSLTNRIGFHLPMFAGFLVLFSSTLMYAFSQTYVLMFVARSLQGVGSALTFAPSLGLLASVFPDDKERGGAMGLALGGLALGVLCGPPFGSIMYEFVGKSAPFLVLAGLALLDGALQLFVLPRSLISPQSATGTPLFTLLRDPYILLSSGALCFSNMAVAILEATLPLWMMETMCPPQWQLGITYLPASVSYLVTTNLFGYLANKMGRWLCVLLGMVVVGVSICCVPLAKNNYELIGPNAGVGVALGMVEAAVMPIMAHLVDIRHVSVYGTIFAISDVALCMGFAIGPLAGGALGQAVGFPLLMTIVGVINIAFAPICYFLRNPPVAEEKMPIVDQEFGVRSYSADETRREFPLSDSSDNGAQ